MFHDRPTRSKLSAAAGSGRGERTDRNVISVWISKRELLGLSVRIHVWLLFEPSDKRACPLKRQVEIIDTEEQQEPVSGCPAVPGSLKWYQALFGQPARRPAHDYFGQILDSDGTVLLCLHKWGAHEHPSLMSEAMRRRLLVGL
jgi:hypothetical protein